MKNRIIILIIIRVENSETNYDLDGDSFKGKFDQMLVGSLQKIGCDHNPSFSMS